MPLRRSIVRGLSWLRKLAADRRPAARSPVLPEGDSPLASQRHVVIGAGLGGLGAAVTLAEQGKSVLVLEHAEQPGGYAVVFERPPYRFDASLHELDGYALGSGEHALLHQLGIADKVELTRLEPLYAVRSADGDVVVPAEFHHYEALLEELFPAERSGIRGWLDDARARSWSSSGSSATSAPSRCIRSRWRRTTRR